MKVSLSWIFDHISTSWKDHDIPDLIKRFNNTSAEVEGYEYITTDLSLFTLIKIIGIKSSSVIGYTEEFDQEVELPLRPGVVVDAFFLIKKNKDQWFWAQGQDFNSEKEGFLPELFITSSEFSGSWKDSFEKEDYVITIKNTSITHRPDLWCHRGVAREFAALLQHKLFDEKHFLADYPIIQSNKVEKKASEDGFVFERQTEKCKQFAGLYISKISSLPSFLSIAHRLLRVDSRPISALVDFTNYVMFDIGHPMHIFDAEKLSDKKLIVKQAVDGQELTVLDGQSLTLSSENSIITDGIKPISLVGIMGGLGSSVDAQTTSVVIESANFDAASIRSTAAHFKLRTEASTRFEKSLDPQQTVIALLRFLHLIEKHKIVYTPCGQIISLGDTIKGHTITLSHEFIEKKLGVKVSSEFVMKTLSFLDFDIQKAESPVIYMIKAPSFRATKDVLIPEDIVEEIGRFFGYDHIPQVLPSLVMKPLVNDNAQKKDTLKQLLAYTASMREVRNYALYDEEFLKTLNWLPTNALMLKNPTSEHMIRLVTSLVPNLLKNICANNAQENVLNFFEWNKIWPVDAQTESSTSIPEQNSLAGIFYDEKNAINFYQKKHFISILFDVLGIEIDWVKADHQKLAPWYHPYKTACIMHESKVIGFAGSVNPGFIQSILPGDAFIFELKGDLLLKIMPKKVVFKPLAKYQDIWRDISMLIPLEITVQRLRDLILKVTPSIFNVELIDFFQKEEWRDKRSVTLRFFARDNNKTLSTEDIDGIYHHVVQALLPLGIEIR